ncbi:MAG: sortase [Clostridia bacterium]|nr:sortase [Clostridia bacterium]
MKNSYKKEIEIHLFVIVILIITIMVFLRIISIAKTIDEKESKNEIIDIQNNESASIPEKILQTVPANEQKLQKSDEIIIPIDIDKEVTKQEESENGIKQEEIIKEDNKQDESQEEKDKEEQGENTSNKVVINTKTDTNTTKKKSNNRKTYTSIGTISIPSLKIKYNILSKTTDALLKKSVTKFWGPNPNEVGNLCIVGHNYKTSKFFGNLPKIKKGTKVYITDLKGKTLTYKVYKTYTVKKEDVSCTSQKTKGRTEITLITCYYTPGATHATKRFIVKARAD